MTTSKSITQRIFEINEAQSKAQREQADLQNERMDALNRIQSQSAAEQSEAQKAQFDLQSRRQEDMQKAVTSLLSERIIALNDTVKGKLEETNILFKTFIQNSKEAQERTDKTVNERLNQMQSSNNEQLDKMRKVVEDKLESTLNERINKSFELVSTRLEEVYKGLGEMKSLAGDVGDLKKVFSGVKTRGILGEIQLGAIIKDILAPNQYEENVPTKKGSRDVVEYAIRLPGTSEDDICYLPIDAKFPGDTYKALVDAYDTADKTQIQSAQKALENRIKSEAKDIHDKYIDPPHTTQFGVMFLPFEGLYAEAVQLGLNETIQRLYNVSIAGPTTLSALLNSLQMGFNTLAIQKRSGEIENVLGAVKTEFGKFGDALGEVQKKMESTSDDLEKLVGVRTRQINRKLKEVTALTEEEVKRYLPSDAED